MRPFYYRGAANYNRGVNDSKMLTRLVATGNILLKLVRGESMNRQWMEIRGTRPNIQKCLREISHSGATIVRAGRTNIFVELHRDELKWLQTAARDSNLRVLNAHEPTYSTALCGAFSTNVRQHQVACKACQETEKQRSQTTVGTKKLFRPRERNTAIRSYATDNPTAALDSFIEPMEALGWTLGINREGKLKTLDNALRNYRAAPALERGHLLKGRVYTSITDLISTTPDPGIDAEGLDSLETPEPVHVEEQESEAKQEPTAPVTLITDSILITTLDGLVKLAQERVDEHMTLAERWETIKLTITSLVDGSQQSEERLRKAQSEVDATNRTLNAVVAAMSDMTRELGN